MTVVTHWTDVSVESVRSPADFLRIADLDATQLFALLDLAVEAKRAPGTWTDLLRGRAVVCCYEKPSTRTRVSTAVAADRLGLLHVEVRPEDMQLSRGETLHDTGQVLAEYADALVLRTHEHRRVEELAEASSVPVINALSDAHHPCQALADLMTLRERFGDLRGLVIAYLGDAHSNIGHSLIEAAVLAGMEVRIATPERYRPDAAVLAGARDVAEAHGGRIEIVEDPREAVDGASAVYPEIWVPMDKEDERERRLRDLSRYRVDDDLMDLCRPDGVFLHCLPAFRGQEVTSEVLDGPRSLVWQQAGNRLHTVQAVLHGLITGSIPVGGHRGGAVEP